MGHAELHADGGAAATEDDFFRSAPFLAAEGVTHTLVVGADRGRVAIPLVVRPIPGTDRSDAISPYGYPGGRGRRRDRRSRRRARSP